MKSEKTPETIESIFAQINEIDQQVSGIESPFESLITNIESEMEKVKVPFQKRICAIERQIEKNEKPFLRRIEKTRKDCDKATEKLRQRRFDLEQRSSRIKELTDKAIQDFAMRNIHREPTDSLEWENFARVVPLKLSMVKGYKKSWFDCDNFDVSVQPTVVMRALKHPDCKIYAARHGEVKVYASYLRGFLAGLLVVKPSRHMEDCNHVWAMVDGQMILNGEEDLSEPLRHWLARLPVLQPEPV